MIIPIQKNSPHYEKKLVKHIYRYGYMPVEGDDTIVSACVEEHPVRLAEPVIRNKVEAYCKQNGLPNEYVASDYGY